MNNTRRNQIKDSLHYKVVDDKTKSVLFETDDNGWDAFDWMMEHLDQFIDIREAYTEEYTNGEMSGWWSAYDLLEENPEGYWISETVKIVLNDDRETYRIENVEGGNNNA